MSLAIFFINILYYFKFKPLNLSFYLYIFNKFEIFIKSKNFLV